LSVSRVSHLSQPSQVSQVSHLSRCPTLLALADQVRRLAPCHRDPERFHLDKSEIERELRRMAADPALGVLPGAVGLYGRAQRSMCA